MLLSQRLCCFTSPPPAVPLQLQRAHLSAKPQKTSFARAFSKRAALEVFLSRLALVPPRQHIDRISPPHVAPRCHRFGVTCTYRYRSSSATMSGVSRAASGPRRTELQDVMECPICCLRFERPLQLSCGHSFCGNCVDRLVSAVKAFLSLDLLSMGYCEDFEMLMSIGAASVVI